MEKFIGRDIILQPTLLNKDNEINLRDKNAKLTSREGRHSCYLVRVQGRLIIQVSLCYEVVAFTFST